MWITGLLRSAWRWWDCCCSCSQLCCLLAGMQRPNYRERRFRYSPWGKETTTTFNLNFSLPNKMRTHFNTKTIETSLFGRTSARVREGLCLISLVESVVGKSNGGERENDQNFCPNNIWWAYLLDGRSILIPLVSNQTYYDLWSWSRLASISQKNTT